MSSIPRSSKIFSTGELSMNGVSRMRRQVEKRREAAYRAKLTRTLKKKPKTAVQSKPAEPLASLEGWEDFEGSGLLR